MSGSVTTSTRLTASELDAASQGWRELFGVAYCVAFGAEAPGVTGEVDLPYLDAGHPSEVPLLVHGYGALQPVAEHDDGYGGAVPDRRLHLLARHQEPAVAAARDDRPVGRRELRRHRRGNAVTHGAVGRGELRVRVVVAPVAVDEDREVPGVVGRAAASAGRVSSMASTTCEGSIPSEERAGGMVLESR